MYQVHVLDNSGLTDGPILPLSDEEPPPQLHQGETATTESEAASAETTGSSGSHTSSTSAHENPPAPPVHESTQHEDTQAESQNAPAPEKKPVAAPSTDKDQAQGKAQVHAPAAVMGMPFLFFSFALLLASPFFSPYQCMF